MTKFLALDIGERRIGVAASDDAGLIAFPLETIRRRSKVEDYARIGELCLGHRAEVLVVGHPVNADDSVGWSARRVERYAGGLIEALQARGLRVTLRLWDEHGSTQRAQAALAAAGRRSRAQRDRIDSAAAAVFLQDYLDTHRGMV